MRNYLAFVFWMLMILPLSAQDRATADRMVAAFETWMQEHGADTGTLAIRYQGWPVLQHGVRVAPGTPMEMASLSKAITGVCVAELVREGRLRYADSFADLLDLGPDVTVAQLLSHTSGLRADSTQEMMLRAIGSGDGLSGQVLKAIVKRGGPGKNPGRYRYNNENYALLGLVVEKVTGTDYRTACTERALGPAGTKAVRSDISHGFLPWGGWKMSADNYAAFLEHWFGQDSVLGQDPFAFPHARMDHGVQYGHGMFFRAFQDDFNFWHHGALCFPGVLNTGSFAVSWKGGWSAVAAYDVCPDRDAMLSLDMTLAKAVFR